MPLRAGSALGWRLVTSCMNEYGFVEPRIADRFRGFLPVVVDVETGGFQSQTDALLEVAAVMIEMTPMGELRPAAIVPLSRAAVSWLAHGSGVDGGERHRPATIRCVRRCPRRKR